MRKYYKWAIVSLATILGLILLFNVAGDFFISEVIRDIEIEEQEPVTESELNIGDKAPSWELEDLEGENVDFTEFLGEPFIITFWSTWNRYSTDQLKILGDYRTNGAFKIITINSQEDKSAVKNFVNRGGYNIGVLLDETGEIGEEYHIRTLPATYFIDAEGVVRERFSGVLSEAMLEEKIASLLTN